MAGSVAEFTRRHQWLQSCYQDARSRARVWRSLTRLATPTRSIVELGDNLALRVVGEGVETDVGLAALRETHCDVAQGFLFARPMAADKLGGWLTPATRAHAVA
jgi:EAL domain-containing protein (putative c-di-GMP-specific phosphodiesterase class I)